MNICDASISEWAAIIIALAALFLAVYEGRQNRRHNRLSIQPRLVHSMRLDGVEGRFHHKVTNVGPGVAHVSSFVLHLGYKEIKDTSLSECMEIIRDELKKEGGIAGSALVNMDIMSDSSLQSGETRILIEIGNDSWKPEYDSAYTRLICRFSFKIDYESAYGERFSISQEPEDPKKYGKLNR